MEYISGITKVVKKGRDLALRRSPTEILVRDATSNETVPPSGQQMRQIADLTYSFQDYIEIMRTLWERIEDDGKNWRHVYKGLLLLDYLLKNGSDRVIQECRARVIPIRTLTEFQHIDDDSKDVGASIRARAKAVVELLHDEKRLEQERKNAAATRDRYGAAMSSDGSHYRNNQSMGGGYPGASRGGGGGGRDDWRRDDRDNYGGSSRRDDSYGSRRDDSYDSRGRDDYEEPAPRRKPASEDNTPKPRRPSGGAAPAPVKPAPNLIDDDFFNPAPSPSAPRPQQIAEEDFFNPRSGPAAPAPAPIAAPRPVVADEDFFAPRVAPAPAPVATQPVTMMTPTPAMPVRNDDDFSEFTGARGAASPSSVTMAPLVPQSVRPTLPAAQSTAAPSADSKDPWSKKNLFDLDSLKITAPAVTANSQPNRAPAPNTFAAPAPSPFASAPTTSAFSSAPANGVYGGQPAYGGNMMMGGNPGMMGNPAMGYGAQPAYGGNMMMGGNPGMMGGNPGMMGGNPGMMGGNPGMMGGNPAMMGGGMMAPAYGQPAYGGMAANPGMNGARPANNTGFPF